MLGAQGDDQLAVVEIALAARDHLFEHAPCRPADDGLGADLLDQFHALAQVLDASQCRELRRVLMLVVGHVARMADELAGLPRSWNA